jgi:hypothetical protein
METKMKRWNEWEPKGKRKGKNKGMFVVDKGRMKSDRLD